MPKRELDRSPEHFEWIVRGRSANQQATMDLYKIIYEKRFELNSNVGLQDAAQKLTAVAFSLWRAVFLSDTTDDYADQLADVQEFLVSLISDNTVLYTTDKNARNWSFHYYVDNARFRLRELAAGDLRLVDESELDREASSDKEDWEITQQILGTAIERFPDAIAAQPKPPEA